MAKNPTTLYDYSFDELSDAMGSEDKATTVYRDLYARRKVGTPSVLKASERLGLPVETLVEQTVHRGSMTEKFLFDLGEGAEYAIESVRIKRRTGFTACVSSQVGCGFGCQFCASGQLGLKRHLTSGEIVQQVLRLGRQINRIVFMGIGEPLHNYDNVLKAIRTLRDRRGRDFQTSGITISSIGIPKALVRLREEHLKLNLTISLHATDQPTRSLIMRGTEQHALDDVIELSQSWAERHNRVVTYVYLVLPGVNDREDDLGQLITWFANRPARMNLMRWNPVDGVDFKRVSDEELHYFKTELLQAGVDVVVRDTQGRDVDAACGQLWLRKTKESQASSRLQLTDKPVAVTSACH